MATTQQKIPILKDIGCSSSGIFFLIASHSICAIIHFGFHDFLRIHVQLHMFAFTQPSLFQKQVDNLSAVFDGIEAKAAAVSSALVPVCAGDIMQFPAEASSSFGASMAEAISTKATKRKAKPHAQYAISSARPKKKSAFA